MSCGHHNICTYTHTVCVRTPYDVGRLPIMTNYKCWPNRNPRSTAVLQQQNRLDDSVPLLQKKISNPTSPKNFLQIHFSKIPICQSPLLQRIFSNSRFSKTTSQTPAPFSFPERNLRWIDDTVSFPIPGPGSSLKKVFSTSPHFALESLTR